MYKKIFQTTGRQNLKHVPTEMREFPFELSKRKDEKWAKFCTLETWADKECKRLVDFDFWIDIDTVGNKGSLPVTTTLEASKGNCALLLDLLSDRYKLEPDHIQTFFSGHSGFHILLPFRLPNEANISDFGIRGNAKRLTEEFAKELAPRWAASSKIDNAIYKESGQIRFPNSRHRNGLRKVRVYRDELDLSVEELLGVIKERSECFNGDYSLDWWEAKMSCEAIETRLLAGKATKPVAIGGGIKHEFEQVETGLPHCLQAVIDLSPGLNWSKITFNDAKMFVLGQLKAIGHTQRAAIETGKDFACRYSDLVGGDLSKVKERKQEFVDSAKTIYKDSIGGRYDYNVPNRCSAIFKAKFPALGRISCHLGKCPRVDKSQPLPSTGRQISIKELLNRKLNGNELLVYLTVAVSGPFTQKKEIEKATGLSKGTVKQVLESLEGRKLVQLEKDKILSLRPVRATLIAKF